MKKGGGGGRFPQRISIYKKCFFNKMKILELKNVIAESKNPVSGFKSWQRQKQGK